MLDLIIKGDLVTVLTDKRQPSEALLATLPYDSDNGINPSFNASSSVVQFGHNLDYFDVPNENSDASASLATLLLLEASGFIKIRSINGIPFADCFVSPQGTHPK